MVTLRAPVSFALGLLACASAPLACHHAENAAYSVPGQVVDESGAPVAGAHVTFGAQNATADASGKFSAPVGGEVNTTFALSVSAAGYADRTLRLTVVGGQPPDLRVVLREVGTTTSVVVPSAGEPPAVVTVTRGDSSSQLSIPAGSLTSASGAQISGKVTVTMTYWQPGEPMLSAPGPLAGIAAAGAAAVPLHSAGMVDVRIEQDGAALQVAPGMGLPWQVTLGPNSQAFYAANAAAMGQMRLWALDTDAAAFVDPSAPGAVSYDAAAGTLTASLGHLSCWNYDYNCADQDVGGNCMTTDNGGCVRGTAYTCAGAPLANASVRLWAIGYGNVIAGNAGIKDFVVPTDPNGHYCATLGTEPAKYGFGDETLIIHVSGDGGPTESNLPCPITGRCQACDQEPTYCNSCANGTESGVADPSAVTYQIHGGDYCPSSNCTPLPDVFIGADCKGIGSCPSTPLAAGAACDARMPRTKNYCCAAGLTCSDNVCVAAVDGGAY